MKVVFSRNADRDLEGIGDWIAEDNPERAVSFVIELREACRTIGASPRGHPLVDGSRDATLRRKVYGNYLIFHDVGPNAVEILHILHGARDYAQIIFPGEPE
ncbi:MAG TPA: type II toxin-antitoxin system RelE/ParE family toxin [Reyranella sp.]